MNLIPFALSILCGLSLAACTIHPFVYRDATRDIASLGGTLLAKSEYMKKSVVTKSGTVLMVERYKGDSTEVGKAYLFYKNAADIINKTGSAATDVIKSF